MDGLRWASRLATASVFALLPSTSFASPPNYASFHRTQKIVHEPDPDELLRIWLVYVNQGDGILIQLPASYDYELEDVEGTVHDEPLDIVVDGGPGRRMSEFLRRVYPRESSVIEYAVLSHHDSDHVAGLTRVVKDFEVPVVFHNGLASHGPSGLEDGFPAEGVPDEPAIFEKKSGNVKRGMAYVGADSRLDARFFVEGLERAKEVHESAGFVGKYRDLVKAVVESTTARFDRTHDAAEFIPEAEAAEGGDLSGVGLEVLWPTPEMSAYDGTSWSKTINGNSVTFRLVYGDFEMLFTGDLNTESMPAVRNHVDHAKLECDVLKVPHHGSDHVDHEFLEIANPVVSVASQGTKGASPGGYKHPSPEVIKTLGGHHRVYNTQVEETPFQWEGFDKDRMYEPRHVLIETDGEWFRVAEVELDHADLDQPPTVKSLSRGEGTRWIRAASGSND